jgi:hypothetical protein
MRNRTLLVIGFICLVAGLTPGSPVPGIFAIKLADAGGALVILATLRFLLALAMGWPLATLASGLIGISQYFVVTGFELQNTAPSRITRLMFLSWTTMIAYCGVTLLLIAALYPLRQWMQAREQAKWDAIARAQRERDRG